MKVLFRLFGVAPNTRSSVSVELIDGRASLVELHHKLLSVADTIDVIQSNCSDTLSVVQETE